MRMISVEKNDFKLSIDPEIEAGYISSDTQTIKKFARGINDLGNLG